LNITVIQLAYSLKALGPQFVCAGIDFFAWCLIHLEPLEIEYADIAFLSLALLFMIIDSKDFEQTRIIELCQWLDAYVQQLSESEIFRWNKEHDWLLSFSVYKHKNQQWVQLGHNLKQWADNQPKSDMCDWVSRIGAALTL
jgi:hypothetical protein